jgi:hypothetical protein
VHRCRNGKRTRCHARGRPRDRYVYMRAKRATATTRRLAAPNHIRVPWRNASTGSTPNRNAATYTAPRRAVSTTNRVERFRKLTARRRRIGNGAPGNATNAARSWRHERRARFRHLTRQAAMVANRGERLTILCADYSCLYLYINSTNVLQYKRTTQESQAPLGVPIKTDSESCVSK